MLLNSEVVLSFLPLFVILEMVVHLVTLLCAQRIKPSYSIESLLVSLVSSILLLILLTLCLKSIPSLFLVVMFIGMIQLVILTCIQRFGIMMLVVFDHAI